MTHRVSFPFPSSAPFAGNIPDEFAATELAGDEAARVACGRSSKNSCRTGQKEDPLTSATDRAAVERQREQEEWDIAMRVMAEQKREENRQKGLRLSLLGDETAVAAEPERESGHQQNQGALADAMGAQESSGAAADYNDVAELGSRLSCAALESMSKKAIVLHIQAIAAPDVLQAYGLSGSPNNVAKKTAKEKVCCPHMVRARKVSDLCFGDPGSHSTSACRH